MESNPRLWFAKAMALGNDFVLWPGYPDDAESLSHNLANRRYGVGCDQIVFFNIQENSTVQVKFHNADGSPAEACGNGTRCLVRWLIEQGHARPDGSVELHTPGGIITGILTVDKRVRLTYALPRDAGALMVPEIAGPCRAVFVGNPHLVCWTDRFDELSEQGPILEQHPYFEARTNVGFACVRPDGDIDLRIWERGTGLTPACGSGALGTAFAGNLLGLTGNQVRVYQEGGVLDVAIHSDFAQLTGEAHIIFEGRGHPHYECWSTLV